MPTQKYFSKCPPFPTDIGVAEIPTISFEKLREGDEASSQKLFKACTEQGFLLLDLRGSQDGEILLNDAEKMFDISAKTLNLDSGVLNRYAYNAPKNLLGYKSAGKLKTDDGKLDTMEMYSLGQDDILDLTKHRENPEPIESHRKECQDFFRHAHGAISVILSHLDKHLALPMGTLASLNPLDKPSATSTSRRQPAEDNQPISLGGHTDIGTMTMLFNVAGGLQFLPAGKENTNENWRYLRPQPGCALINPGDTLVELSGGLLRSSLHRVVSAPGEQATVARQSLAYLVRAEDNVLMKRLRSAVIPPLADGEEDAKMSVNEWAALRAMQIMKGEMKQESRGGVRVQITAVESR